MFTQITYQEFKSRRREYDEAVKKTPWVSQFCSSSSWIISAREAFHEISDTAEDLIFTNGEYWVVFLKRNERDFYPFESSWMFNSPVIGPEAKRLMLLMISASQALEGYHGYVFGGIRKQSELHREIEAWQDKVPHYQEFSATDCMVFFLKQGADHYLAGRSKKFRKSLKTSVRRCEEAGVTYEVIENAESEALLERLMHLQKKTHKWASGEDIFQVEECYRFYRRLLKEMIDQSQLLVIIAQIEGQDVAFIWGAVFGKSYRGLQMSFDDQYRELGLGNVLQWRNIQLAAEKGIETYDLGMHAPYKERWTEEQREFVGTFLVA